METLDCGRGNGGGGDGLEGVDGEGVEEFVGEDKGRFGGVWGWVLVGLFERERLGRGNRAWGQEGRTEGWATIWDESNVLAPDDWEVRVFAAAAEADIDLLHGLAAAEELLLLVAEGGARFDEVDGLDAGG